MLFRSSFPEVWLFFQGALFLLVVTALPDGIVGWLQKQIPDSLRSRFGTPGEIVYPQADLDSELQPEPQEVSD